MPAITKLAFASEACLVEQFVGMLQSGRTAFGSLQVTTEWDHRSGFVDVLVRDKRERLVAFEAKLTDWRRAFLQAYRSTAYANLTYVLLPAAVAHRAFAHKDEFEFRGIGLCAFDGRSIKVLIEPVDQEALLGWVRSRAHEHFDGLANDQRKRSRSRSGGSALRT
jgi:hypothetical protein